MSVASEAPPLPGATGEAAGPSEASDTVGIDGLTSSDRVRLRRAWWGAALPTLALFSWVLTAGRWDLLQRQYFDNFFDAQTRAMFDGRLDVPPDVVGFEGFITHGKTYIYFGPFPAFLRMPLMALTDRYDGRLTTLSILAATVALVYAAFRLSCSLRRLVRGTDPVGRRELWATAGLSVAVLAAPPLFLMSSAVVYHEATMWGLAFTVGAYDGIVRWQRDRRGWRLLVISLLFAGGLMSRQTVALGPVAALGLVGLAELIRLWRNRPALDLDAAPGLDAPPEETIPAAPAVPAADADDPAEPEPRPAPQPELRPKATAGLRPLLGLAVALALTAFIPLAISSAFNQAKLGQLFGLPMGRQAFAENLTNRAAVLEENPSYASASFLGTTSWTYLRPVGLDVRRDLPWIDFPRTGPEVVGGEDVTFDVLDWSSSLPVTAPALTVLTVGGLVWTVRTRRRRGPDARLWPYWVGTVVGSTSVLLFAFIANRYLADLYPVVVVGGLIGFHAAGQASARWRPGRRRVLLGGVGVLIVAGLVVNLALALEYQRERGPVVPEAWRADWVRWRMDLPGAPEADTVDLDQGFPPVADGGLLAVGDCDGLYVGVRDRWLAVERGPGVGVYDLVVDLDDLPVGDRFPLLSYGGADDETQATVVAVVRTDERTIRVDVLLPDFFESDWQLGLPTELSGRVTLRVVGDPRQPTSNVVHGTTLLNPQNLPAIAEPVRAGEAPGREGVAGRWPGSVRTLAPDDALCRDATG
ncbi:MAG TPA: hypothetical protein VGO78_02640 [Acidimicrobiales bacterium]|nr:hypothetical protein [Acidimicrobiales bacterium]